MISTRFAKAAIVAATLSVAAPLAMAQNIAVVNGKGVPKSRVDALVDQIARSQPGGAIERTPDLEQKLRDEVVIREIYMQEAQRRGLQASPDYRAQMELARQAILIQTLFKDFEKKNPASEAEARAEYDQIKAANGDKEYRARHILVDSEAEAKSLLGQIKAGAKFEELAKKHSKDPGSGPNGGDLDWANPGNYVPEFSEAMVKLKKGEVSPAPVQSQFGWHIIKLEDTRQTAFPAFEEVKDQLMQRQKQAKLARFQEELRKSAKTDYKFSE
ncbi:peptidylprolyl isomerase [Aquabacterium fontiphilum]|uniref:peptidylprolyl isomerase n=1 Tax=Aquabacterium fontiphilum TaxID=450365 RepID=UPI00137667E6|nr:peptidylprolyl isomerase [Aquabacterium fontiphilum]NBD22004.1 peptidylprolyl isomerase [Aquabacterium fontiphilum]